MRKIILLLLLSFLVFKESKAQEPLNIDSLKKILNDNQKQDTTRAERLIQLGSSIKSLTGNMEQSLKYTNEAIALSKKLNWTSGLYFGYRQIGIIFGENADYSNALEYNYKALGISNKLNDEDKNTMIYNSLGLIYIQTGEYNKAKEYFTLFYKYALNSKKENAKTVLIYGLNNLGVLYQQMKISDSSLWYYKSALKIALDNKLASAYPNLFCNVALGYASLQQIDSAIKYCNGCYEAAKNSGNIPILGKATATFADVYTHTSDFNKAIYYAKKAIPLLRSVGNAVDVKSLYNMLSDLYATQNKNAEALQFYKLFISLRDSILDNDKKQELYKKDLQLNSQRKEILSKAELQKEKTIKQFILAGAVLLLLAAIAIFFFYKKRRDILQQQKELALKAQAANTEMKVLRLQMNPHFIFNSLNSISDYISKNDIPAADFYLSKFAKLMRGTLENSEEKEIPLADELKILELYMQLEAMRLGNRFSYEIKIADGIDPQTTMVPPLILQPFVENSIWHGLAKKEGGGKIIIEVTKENEMFNCIIEDNGVGRSATAKDTNKKSMGMKITQDRIDLLNRFKNTNASVHMVDLQLGTRAEVKLPFEVEA